MNLELTRHARNRMRHARLDESDVEAMVASPDASAVDARGRTVVRKRIHGATFRVVYVMEDERLVIITVFEEL